MPEEELGAWFTKIRQALERAYLVGATPWQASGKRGSFEDWTHLRLPNLVPVIQNGSYLDIGCANGFLLECLLVWGALKGVEITPFGLDYSEKLRALARERLPDYVDQTFAGTPGIGHRR